MQIGAKAKKPRMGSWKPFGSFSSPAAAFLLLLALLVGSARTSTPCQSGGKIGSSPAFSSHQPLVFAQSFMASDYVIINNFTVFLIPIDRRSPSPASSSLRPLSPSVNWVPIKNKLNYEQTEDSRNRPIPNRHCGSDESTNPP